MLCSKGVKTEFKFTYVAVSVRSRVNRFILLCACVIINHFATTDSKPYTRVPTIMYRRIIVRLNCL